MATPLPRISQKLFGATGPVGDFGAFGSKALNPAAPIFTQDPTVIQSLPEFGIGWGAAIIGNYDPPLEDMNGLFLLLTRQLAYIFEKGIPEYDPLINYFVGSLVQVAGQIYNSVSNSNLGNNPATDNGTNWQPGIGGLNGAVPTGVTSQFAGPRTSIPAGYLLCDGRAVSRTTYLNLFNVVGTVYGAGDGTTTFNLPNGQGTIFIGQLPSDPNFGTVGVYGGEAKHTLTVAEIPPLTVICNDNSNSGGGTTPFCSIGTHFINVSTNGGGQAHNNLQPYLVVGGTIIKY